MNSRLVTRSSNCTVPLVSGNVQNQVWSRWSFPGRWDPQISPRSREFGVKEPGETSSAHQKDWGHVAFPKIPTWIPLAIWSLVIPHLPKFPGWNLRWILTEGEAGAGGTTSPSQILGS